MVTETLAIGSLILSSAKLGYDVLKAWLEHTKGRERKAGIRKFVAALNATSDYLDRTKKLKKDRDLEAEKKLDKLWRVAAEALIPIDRPLSERLYLKAEYWRNPDRFKTSPTAKAELDEAHIRLMDIRNELTKLL